MAFFQLNNRDATQSSSPLDFHQDLQEKVDSLQQAIRDNRNPNDVMDLIKKLKYDAVKYFANHEKGLLYNNSKSYHYHRKAHDRFIWKISDLQTEFRAVDPHQALALCSQLQDWFSSYLNDYHAKESPLQNEEVKKNTLAS